MAMLLAVMLAVLPLLTHQQCWAPPRAEESNSNTLQSLISGQQKFSFDLLREMASNSPRENVFFSPVSVYKALILAYFGSANHTEVELKKALHIPDELPKSEVMKAFMFEKLQRLSATQTNSSSGQQLTITNRLFFAKNLKLKDCIAIVFHDETTMLDFASDSEGARLFINNWVEMQTGRNIKDLLTPEQIQSQTQIVLVNTAYFKGEWETGFKQTISEPFHITSTENVTVPMMRQKGEFGMYINEDLASHILELPYKGDVMSMYILMPRARTNQTVDTLISRLNVDMLDGITDQMKLMAETFNIGLPKFTVEKSVEITPILERLGVGDLFQETSDLSDFTGSRGILLDEAQHKAKIEVDEVGTKAAAATVFFGTRSSRPNFPKFTVNRPFVYLIYDKVEKTVHFAGVFRSPMA